MSRVGQTMMGFRNNKPCPVICIRDGPRVQWRSLDLQSYGDLAADTWDRMRTEQREARRDEGENLPE